jgi:hypothetical protein
MARRRLPTLLLVLLTLLTTWINYRQHVHMKPVESNPKIRFKYDYLYSAQSGESRQSQSAQEEEVGVGSYDYQPRDLCIFIFSTPKHLRTRSFSVQNTWKRHAERLGARVYFVVPSDTKLTDINAGPDFTVFSDQLNHPFPLSGESQRDNWYKDKPSYDSLASILIADTPDSEGKSLKARTMWIWKFMYTTFIQASPDHLEKVVNPFQHNDSLIARTDPPPKWFFKVDDDTFVHVENLLRQLSKFRATNQDIPRAVPNAVQTDAEPLFIGRRMNFGLPVQHTFNSGGAGYLLNQVALAQLFGNDENMRKCLDVYNQGSIEGEDVLFARCLSDGIGVLPYHPSLSNKPFHPSANESNIPHINGFHWQKPRDMMSHEHYDPAGWFKWPVVYHWLEPGEMFALWFFMYEMNFM